MLGLPTVDGWDRRCPPKLPRRPRRGREQEGNVVGAGQTRSAAPDRVVDHVDTVGNGLVDGICQVTAEAALLATGLVGGDVGPVREAGDDAAVDPEDLRGDIRVAPGGACGVSAVTVRVPSRVVELLGPMNSLYSVRMPRRRSACCCTRRRRHPDCARCPRNRTRKDHLVLRIGIDVDVLDGDRWC